MEKKVTNVSIKAKEVGSQVLQIIKVTVKDQETEFFDPAQGNLFEGNVSMLTGEET